MKKFVSVLLSLAMLMSMLVVPVAAEEEAAGAGAAAPVHDAYDAYGIGQDAAPSGGSNLSLLTDVVYVTQEDCFKVVVHMRANQVSSFTGHLEFDTDQLKCVGVSADEAYYAMAESALVAQLSTGDEANRSGKVGWGFARAAETGCNDGDLVTVEFRAIGSGRTYIGLYEDSAGTDGFKGGNGAATIVEIETRHVHECDQQVAEQRYLVSAATCGEPAVYYKSCICGEPGAETFTYGEPLGHDFSAERAEEQYRVPDTTDQYYKSCVRCGKAGTETFTVFTEGQLVLRIVPQQSTICPNAADRTVKFDVIIEQNPGIAGLYFTLEPDSGLELTDIQSGSLAGLTLTPNVDERIIMADALRNTDATGTLATLVLRVTDEGTAGSLLRVGATGDPESIFNESDEFVPYSVCGDALQIAHIFDRETVADQYLASAATCTRQALYYKSCACGEPGTETFAYGELLSHDWDDGEVTTQPTCTEKGVRTYCCRNCDATKTADVAALGHKANETPAKAETCTEPGNSAYYTCQRCGKFFRDAACTEEIEKDSWIIPAKDHDWDDGAVTTQPTCLEDGVRTFTCRNCQETRTETEKAPGTHDFAPVSAVPASADAEGVLHLACTRCGEESTQSFALADAAVQLTVGTADGSAKIHRGDMQVPVELIGEAVSGMSMTVAYDETRLTLTGVSEGWTLSGNTVSTDSAVSAGTAVTLTFTVAVDAEGFVNPGDAVISIAAVTAQGADGALTVGQTTGKVVITKAGDINGDGKVNVRDVVLLRRIVAKLQSAADAVPGSTNVNNDNSVNVRDIVKLRRVVAKLKDASGNDEVAY